MIRTLICTILVLAAGTGVTAQERSAVVLAENGEARLPIVIGSAASERTKLVARELAHYLERITGAHFEVTTGDGSKGIVVGTIAEWPDARLSEALAVRNGCDGVEAFAIGTDAGRPRVRLLGATDLGASHAVFRFLEHLGCRWFFPAKQWEVIPSIRKLAVALDQTDRPVILSRRIWWGYGFFDQRSRNDYEAWARHNCMAQSRKIWCGHAWQSIIRDNQALFDAHPEYLALVDGKRRGPQFCVSNRAVRRLAVEWALEQLRKRPELDMVSMEPSDGSNHCQCDACEKLGSISDRVFGLANEVARAVAAKYPGKMVGLYAYNDHCEPPSFPLEANVYVQSTAGFIRGRYTFEELMELWPTRCRNLGFYEYFSVWLWDFDMLPGGRGANAGYICRQIRRYAALGATSVDCESGNNWGVHGRGYYLANRLMWNPQADPEALLNDFYEKAFGPAAHTMQRYYERLDPGREPLLSEHLLAMALRDLEEASQKAKDRPDVLARLAHLKQYLHYVRLRWDYEHATEKQEKKAAALACLTHVYRTRHSYMNHWAAMRQCFSRRVADQFQEPSWAFDHREATPPWKVDDPLTMEDTERLFKEDLARFQPQPVQERSFSTDLVPVALTTESPAATRQQFQGAGRYAVWSHKGEPIELVITTGLIAWYRDRPPAAYKVTTANGRHVAQGRLPQDGQPHSLRIEVPTPGLYWFDFDDQAAGWRIEASAGHCVCLVLSRGRHPAHMGHMQQMYFYVPQGTRRIEYYWKGRPHVVHLPNGKQACQVTTSGKFVSIEVPAGSDGRCWSFSKLALGHLWFFNVPNYLAASPDGLLVPRELFSRDR